MKTEHRIFLKEQRIFCGLALIFSILPHITAYLAAIFFFKIYWPLPFFTPYIVGFPVGYIIARKYMGELLSKLHDHDFVSLYHHYHRRTVIKIFLISIPIGFIFFYLFVVLYPLAVPRLEVSGYAPVSPYVAMSIGYVFLTAFGCIAGYCLWFIRNTAELYEET